jgi:hypothetical protein
MMMESMAFINIESFITNRNDAMVFVPWLSLQQIIKEVYANHIPLSYIYPTV